MHMEEIFQEFLLSVGISVAVCCMIMKLKPYGDGEGGGPCKRSYDETVKVGVSLQKSEEHEFSFGSGKSRGGWLLDELFKQLSAEKFCETNVTGYGEIASELVEDEGAMLKDLSIVKETVCGDESKGFCHEIYNVVDNRDVVSELIEDVDVFRRLRRRKEDVDGCIERLSVNEIEECLDNDVEENFLILDTQEIQDKYKRLGEARTEKENFGEIEQGLYEDDELSQDTIEEISQILGIEDGEQCEQREEKEEEGFNDWEGVERTELEKLFGAAVVFVCSKSNGSYIDRAMEIELYGLHKIAIEGPCRGAQPMVLNISARAKWDSWKKLGNMRRELAMEQYLLVLSERVPAWTRSD